MAGPQDQEQASERAKAHLRLCDAVIRGVGGELWRSGVTGVQFAQQVASLAEQVYDQHLERMRQAEAAGDIIPLHCRVLSVESPYQKNGQVFDLARVRIMPFVGRTQREQNMWIDLRDASGPSLVEEAQRYLNQECRVLQQVRVVFGPDGQPVMTDDGKRQQHHYVVGFEPAPGQGGRPASAPQAAPAPAPQAAPAPADGAIPAGYSNAEEANVARRRVLDKIAELRQVDPALAERGKDTIKQQNLGWPQPPDRIELILRVLDTLRQEYQEVSAAPAGGAVPVGGAVQAPAAAEPSTQQAPPPAAPPEDDDHYEW